MAITQRLRYEILRRDNHACRYCGVTAGEAKLTIDHVVPKALGGGDEPTNLVAACERCNNGKAATGPDTPLVEDVKQDAIRWHTAIALACEQRAGDRRAAGDYAAAFLSAWRSYANAMGRHRPLPDNWADSIETFYQRGLPVEDLTAAVHTAMGRSVVGPNQKFRYMAGICWRVLTEIEDAAAQIIEDQKGGE